jgi:hypothetical protein
MWRDAQTVALKFTAQPHAISTAFDPVRALKKAAEIGATIAGLRRALFCAIPAHEAIWIGDNRCRSRQKIRERLQKLSMLRQRRQATRPA